MRKTNTVSKTYDLVVIGGGLSGMCCAIAAARHGIKTALIQDRPVLGGNASSEIRMHICGADKHGRVADARETGIIEELLLTNRFYNTEHSFSVQDVIFFNFLQNDQNLDLFLNTCALTCSCKNNSIISVTAYQSSTETKFVFYAKFFADNSGDGVIAAKSGAKYVYGRESKYTYNEPDAPECEDKNVMGSSIMFTAKDVGHNVPFIKPHWAYNFNEEDLSLRDHSQITSGYWWLEVGGELNTIEQNDEVYTELLKVLFGVWDHIKNTPGHNADNYALDWIGNVVGKRESRRFIGDYVLNENDLSSPRDFDDAVAYGGWNMDIHVPNGIFAFSKQPTTYYPVNHLYGIPYRSLYSVNIKNLFLGGRLISASHIAFGSTRVMGTCAVIGQAIGTAAALAVKSDYNSAKNINKQIKTLQQMLLKDDCFIPNLKNTDPLDLAKKAFVSTTSQKESSPCHNVINGFSRNVNGKINYFEGINLFDDILTLKWQNSIIINEIHISFDSDLSSELTITISDEVRKRQQTFPKHLAKDFTIVLSQNNTIINKLDIKNNILRHRIFSFSPIEIDELSIQVTSTHGKASPRIFEVRVY